MEIKSYMILLLVIVVAGATACKKKTDSSKEAEELKLQTLLAEIKGLSEQVKCVNEADWKFRPIGSKPCGGPTGYVSYSSKIDTLAFIQKVEKYTAEQENFNKKWNMVSDCMFMSPPKKVVCENEKPKLVYQ
jgi:hypothetical protein